MADFQQTMRDWRRMCKTYTTDDDETCCAGCPIMALEYSEHGCDAIFSDWAESADWEEVEDIIKTWAAENPEPQYPTWAEWLESMHVVNPIISPDTSSQYVLKAWYYGSPIPADIAQKLGLEPKEGA